MYACIAAIGIDSVDMVSDIKYRLPPPGPLNKLDLFMEHNLKIYRAKVW